MVTVKSCSSIKASAFCKDLIPRRYFVLEDFYAIGEDEREKPEVPDFETIMTGPVVVKQPKPESQITEATEERSFSDAPAVSPPKRKRLVDERPISRSSAAAPTSDFGRPDVETPSPPSPKRCRLIDERPTSRSSAVAPIGGFGRPDNTEILRPKAKARPPSSSPSSQTRAEKRKLEIALGEIDSNFGSPPKKKPSLPAAQGRKPSSVLHKEVSSSQERSLPRQKEQKQHKSLKYNKKVPTKVSAAGPSYSGPGIGAQHAQSAPAPLIPIKRPLNIVPLSKLRGCRRNQVHDVFVVIESVGDEVVKPARMPSKRDLRVVDPSTEKKVLLCIFVDPERFKPAAGTIALIRSVTTHEWEGGMINIYPQQCNGKQWFIPNPIGVQGCDVEGMRRWWAEKQAAEVK